MRRQKGVDCLAVEGRLAQRTLPEVVLIEAVGGAEQQLPPLEGHGADVLGRPTGRQAIAVGGGVEDEQAVLGAQKEQVALRDEAVDAAVVGRTAVEMGVGVVAVVAVEAAFGAQPDDSPRVVGEAADGRRAIQLNVVEIRLDAPGGHGARRPQGQ